MPDLSLIRCCWIHFSVLLVVGLSLFGQAKTSKNVLCYNANWSFHNWYGGIKFTIADVNTTLCTHLVYAHAHVKNLRVVPTEPEDHYLNGWWRQFVELKKTKPGLKVLLSVGGFKQNVNHLRQVVENFHNKTRFIRHVIDHLRYWDFDGIDFHWYAPLPGDKTNTKNFIEELSEAFKQEQISSGKDRLILMMTVNPNLENIQGGIDIKGLKTVVDLFHVRTFDYVSDSDETQLDTPLYSLSGESVSKGISYYVDGGVPPEKLHLGLRLYATRFFLLDPELTGVGAPARYGGKFMAHYSVCKSLKEGSYTVDMDPLGMVNYAYNSTQWMTYEDSFTLMMKITLVFTYNLGGVAVYTIDADDFTGQFCGQGSYPLLNAINRDLSDGF